MTGVLILGHGSRAEEANGSVRQISEMVREQSGLSLVQPAYMAFGSPSLSEGITRLVEAGARRVVVVPLFLYNGIHVQEDIPAALELERRRHPGGVEIIFGGNLGPDRRIADIIIDRIREVGECVS